MRSPAFLLSPLISSIPSTRRVCNLRNPHARRNVANIAMKVSTDGTGAGNSGTGTDSVVILTEGDIVAVVRGSSGVRAELGVVTGTDSSGRNVDFVPLKAYIPELYVRDGDDGARFVRASLVRRVPATWVEDQGGWIVLNADIEAAEQEISVSMSTTNIDGKAQVLSAPSAYEPLKTAPKRDIFRPTRIQAFIGAALSIPVAALAYAVFAGERAAFVSQQEGALLDVSLIIAASISVFSLITGAALFLYGVNSPPEEKE